MTPQKTREPNSFNASGSVSNWYFFMQDLATVVPDLEPSGIDLLCVSLSFFVASFVRLTSSNVILSNDTNLCLDFRFINNQFLWPGLIIFIITVTSMI